MTKIFLDSADIDEIKAVAGWGVLDGVTTNPTLIKQALAKRASGAVGAADLEAYVRDILTAAGGTPVSLEVDCAAADTMVTQGEALYDLFKDHGNVVIKVPINPAHDGANISGYDGVRAIKQLSMLSIPVNVTLVFTVQQALLAHKAGAAYVSPFCGRTDDYLKTILDKSLNGWGGLREDIKKNPYYPAEGKHDCADEGIRSGVDLVKKIRQLYAAFPNRPYILAASIRTPQQFYECALAGAECITAPKSIIEALPGHAKTAEGAKRFKTDMDGVPEWRTLMTKK